MIQSFSHITPVPQSNELIDIALSKTNRKTPTVIHPGYEIQRIRSFYLRKVKHSAKEFCSRLEGIVGQFPVLEDIHPFYSDLISVLYDKDHFKIALGQINAAKTKIDRIMDEHLKLLKFGDSLFRCKQLKRAALGKMATTVKKLAQPLKYLEEVRQHLSRLPSIDTATRSIIICGYPNVGKSSFMNSVSRAHVDVQPYAFTTKSLYVGHFEYENLRWQIIDTPGILDHPLQERNTVEMLTITALAHLRSAVLFFLDLSENCGYSIADQVSLYESLTPLLNSQILIVLSKCDVLKLADVCDPGLSRFLQDKQFVEVSTLENINIDLARNTICNILLAERVSEKQSRVEGFAHRIKPLVPEHPINDKTEESGHLGQSQFYGLHENETYFCNDRYDIIPEFYNGKNVADFLDASTLQNLQQVADEDHSSRLRTYDVLTPEQRRMYEDCNNARMHANMMSIFRKRASVPEHRKNPLDASKVQEFDLVDPGAAKRTALAAVRREPRNKKVQKNLERKYADTKPKHLFRHTGSKHKHN